MANRLAEVISQVIHPDQSYCVPRRSIVDNISLIRDALEMSKLLNLDFGLISLDQEKAFDRVEHLYLWKTLEAFGFKQDFIKMVQVLYSCKDWSKAGDPSAVIYIFIRQRQNHTGNGQRA